MDAQIEKLAREWIDAWSGEKIPPIGDGVSESALDWELPRINPELCLNVIERILSIIPPEPMNRQFQALAAGPLEDLLVENGDAVIERVDILARQRPEFRLLLNGAWLSHAKPEIREQIKKYLGAPW